jgi:phage terminase small subunit
MNGSKLMNELTAKQLRLFNKLTPLQQEVCNGVLFKGMNQTDSYRQSRGKAKTDNAAQAGASEILSNPKVKAFMDNVMQSRLTDSIADRNEVLEKLTTIIREKPGDEITKVAADRAAMEAIRQIRSMEGWDAAQRVDVQGKVDVSLDEPVAGVFLEQNEEEKEPEMDPGEVDKLTVKP